MPDTPPTPEPAARPGPLARISLDWWTVIIAGAFVVLALLDVLPKIGW